MNNINELENFLYYLQDKIKDCYKQETKQAIDRFLKEFKKGVDLK